MHTATQDEKVNKALAANIRRRRREAGMSQVKMAEEIGMSVAQVAKYESGKNRVTAARLLRIAETLRVPLSSFFEGEDMDAALTPPESSRLRLELVRNFDRISDPGARSDVVRLAARLAEPKE